MRFLAWRDLEVPVIYVGLAQVGTHAHTNTILMEYQYKYRCGVRGLGRGLGRGFVGGKGEGGRHEAQAPSHLVKNYRETWG
jgi:hypothetical protein